MRAADALLLVMKDVMKDPKDLHAVVPLVEALLAVAARIEARYAATTSAQAATAHVEAMRDTNYASNLRSLAQLLYDIPPAEISPRSAGTASAVALPAGTAHPLMAFALLIPAAEPAPWRLSTQQIVELLKMPTCTGNARRIILDQLGNRYHRTFADVWQFVRFAEEQKLGLDFTTPPQRPDVGSRTP
jgi:hypothetical protein